jgi:predicted DCC family thiol-disulfide oxidoreductase YuxK
VEEVPSKPILIYDGDCGFCRKSVGRLRLFLGDRLDYLPSQNAPTQFPQLSTVLFSHSVHLLEPDGRLTSAAHAVFRCLALRPLGEPLLWLYQHVPFFATSSEGFYRWVARNRNLFSGCSNE